MADITLAAERGRPVGSAASRRLRNQGRIPAVVYGHDADPLPIPDQPGGMLHAHDGRQAVLPCDHRAMGHQAPHLRHQALDRDDPAAGDDRLGRPHR